MGVLTWAFGASERAHQGGNTSWIYDGDLVWT